MHEPTFENPILEAAFRQAVIDDFEAELRELELQPSYSNKNATFSSRHNRRMSALFARERRRARKLRYGRCVRRCAAVCALLVVVFCAVLAAVPKVRATVCETVAQWFDKFVKFRATVGGSVNLCRAWTVSALPDGFVEAERSRADDLTAVIYANADGGVIYFTYVPIEDSVSVNNESAEYQQTTIDEIVYYTFEPEPDESPSVVIWDMDGRRFSLTGFVSASDLLEMAKSVSITVDLIYS